MENRGIDPRTSRMLSERSTIWASSPGDLNGSHFGVNMGDIFRPLIFKMVSSDGTLGSNPFVVVRLEGGRDV